MGNGIDNRGLTYLSIGFERSRDTDYIVDRLEEAVGFRFEGTMAMSIFRDRIDKSRINAATTSDNKQLELLFTLVQGKSWRDARDDPARYVLVQSKKQKALQDQYDKEDAEEAALKKQRAADYDARMEAQKKDDAAKLIIRDSHGNELLNIYAIQHRGSDYAARLNASFEVYGRSGFDEQYLRQVVIDYYALLNSQLTDLKEFNDFLMSESATRLGRVVTWTGGIDRPNQTNVLVVYDELLSKALKEYKAGTAPELTLDQMARVESYCSYASGILERFYEESVSQANRIALALQIAQMAIPVGGSAAFLEALCIEAAGKFSYAITNKIVNGSDQSWAKTLTGAAVGSVRDTIMRLAVTKLVGKIPKINGIGGIKGDAIKLAVNTLTSEVAQSMAGFFEGKTFGEALANLYRNLKSPETWVGALVNHAANVGFGKYLDVPQPAGPVGKTLPEGSGTRIEPVKKPIKIPKKPALAVTVALMFGPAAHSSVDPHPGKPTITETQAGDASRTGNPPAPADRPDYLNRGVDEKGLGSKANKTGADKPPQKGNQADPATSNATAGPAKPVKTGAAASENASGRGQKPPAKPPKAPPTAQPVAPPKRKKSKPGDLRTIDDDDEGVELILAYQRVGFVKKKNSDSYRYIPYGKYQTTKTGKDYEYAVEFINSDGMKVRIEPDDLIISDSGKRINIQEYKHVNDPAPSAEIMALIAKNKNIQTKEVYDKLNQSNAHYKFMGDKLYQMMNYVEALAKFPGSLEKVTYHCSDGATQLTYQGVLDSLHGIYLDKPALLKLLDKIDIVLDRP